MGADDSNQGTSPGECPAHDWQPAGLTLTGHGAYVQQTCTTCGAVAMVGPDELTGRSGGPTTGNA